MSDAPSEFDPVEVLADSFLQRYRRGERPSLSEYVRRHPELAEQIRELFPALVVVEELGSVGNRAGPAPKLDASSVPVQLGEYRIVREIGRGGMGIVYEAVQGSLGRHVALKVLPFQGLMNPTHLERFRREARAAARLHHTNIVPVFGVGEHAGIHYYAMQFIHGQGLNEVLQEVKRLRTNKEASAPFQSASASVAESLFNGKFALPSESQAGQLPDASSHHDVDASCAPEFRQSNLSSQPEARYFRQVALIGVQVADALEYAHGESVLHRDIKPSNLLLDIQGRVWVTDFGLAKTDETEEVTDPGDIVGTLCYMAPERLQGRADACSDVYGLGITLYELATLQAAFVDTQRAGLIEKVTHAEPPRPRKVDPKIPRDLETIILKAIAKEPSQRFASARALAEDLRRFLADRPIQARRTSLRERLWRWCRRNPVVAGLTGFVAVLLAVIAAGSLLMTGWAVQATERLRKESAATLEEQKRAERAEREVQEKRLDSFLANLGKARSIRLSHQAGQRFECLKALGAAADLARSLNLGQEHFLDLRNEAIACSVLPDLQVMHRWETNTPWIGVDSQLERYVCLDGRGAISVRRITDNRELIRVPCPVPSFWNAELQFDPTGRYLAVRFDIKQPSQLFLWDLSQGGSAPKIQIAGWSLRFCPGQPQAVVVLADGSLSVCELRSWKLRPLRSAGLVTRRCEVPFDALGRQIALAGRDDHRVRIVDVESDTASIVGTLPDSMDPCCLAWSGDGKKMALANSNDFRIYVYRVPEWQLWRVLEGHQGLIFGLAFAPSGELLTSASWDGFTILWDAARGRKLLSSPGYFLGFGPAGKQLAFRDHTKVGVWQVTPGAEFTVLDQPANRVAFSPDGRLLAGSGEGVGIWDAAALCELAHLPLGPCRFVAFEPDGKGLVTCGEKTGHRWPIQTDPEKLHYRIGPPQTLDLQAPEGVAFTSNGLWGVAALEGLVLNPGQREKKCILALSQINHVGLSPDGRWAAATAWNRSGVRIWDLAQPALGPRPVFDLASGQNNHSNPAFSPDGRWLVATSIDAHRFWRVGSWELNHQLPRDRIEPYGGPAAFSSDGRVLALCRTSQLVQLVDPTSYRELATLHAPEPANINSLAFNRDSSCLAVACPGRCIQLWHLRAIREGLAKLGLDWGGEGETNRFGRESDSSLLTSHPSLRTTPIRLQADLGYLPLLARAEEHERRRDYDRMLAALKQIVKQSPAGTQAYAQKCNILAWRLVAGPKADHDPAKALPLAEAAVGWAPQEWSYVNTLGVVYYRLGRYQQALATLELSLRERQGKFAAFDLFFLAMSHARLGNPAKAKECYDQAVKWVAQHDELPAKCVQELRESQAEARELIESLSKR